MSLTFPCNACGSDIPVGIDGYLCPKCGYDFRSNPPPIKITVPPDPAKRSWFPHPAKILMLIVTFGWLIITPLLAYITYRAAWDGFRKVGPNTYISLTIGNYETYSDSEIGARGMQNALIIVGITSFLYFIAIGVLFVVWFATKGPPS